MTFKIELTSKKDAAGVMSYDVSVTQDGTAPATATVHSFSTMEAAEQFKKAQVAQFLGKK
jgi:hypothetical protein